MHQNHAPLDRRGDIDVAYGVGQAHGEGDIHEVQVVGLLIPREYKTLAHSTGERTAMGISLVIIQPGVVLSNGGVQETPGHDHDPNAQAHQETRLAWILLPNDHFPKHKTGDHAAGTDFIVSGSGN